ncbi:MAG: hypothetical protein WC454_06545, partial [Phycisphaerae bacterium]
EVPWSFNISFKYGEAHITDIARDYMTVIFVPLWPLGLSAYGTGGLLRMDQKQIRNLLENLKFVFGSSNLERQKKTIPIVRSYIIAAITALVGALVLGIVGYMILGILGSLFALAGAGSTNLIFLISIRPRKVQGLSLAGNSWPRR